MYFSIWEASTLIDLFFVKVRCVRFQCAEKKYSSIPNNSVAGADVSTTTGFNSLKREWLSFIIALQLITKRFIVNMKRYTNFCIMRIYVIGMMGV